MQRVVLFRHGPAEDPVSGVPDSDRALTQEGRTLTDSVARGLADVLGAVALLASSPLLRARQTAEVLAQRLEVAGRQENPLLKPTAPAEALLDWIASQQGGLIVLVGHEPQLNTIVGLATTGRAQRLLAFAKAGACLLEFQRHVAPASAILAWHLTPALLQRGPGPVA